MSAPPPAAPHWGLNFLLGRIIFVSLADDRNGTMDRRVVDCNNFIRNHLINMNDVRALHTHRDLCTRNAKEIEEKKTPLLSEDSAEGARARRLNKFQPFHELPTLSDEAQQLRIEHAIKAQEMLAESSQLPYRHYMELGRVTHVQVNPDTIREKLREAMDVPGRLHSALLVVTGHGKEVIQQQYPWGEILQPYADRLDGVVFNVCWGQQLIEPQLQGCPILSVTFDRPVNASDFGPLDSLKFLLQAYLSWVSGGWYLQWNLDVFMDFICGPKVREMQTRKNAGQQLSAEEKGTVAFLEQIERAIAQDEDPTYNPPTQPLGNRNLMHALMAFANMAGHRDRLCEHTRKKLNEYSEQNLNVADVTEMHWRENA